MVEEDAQALVQEVLDEDGQEDGNWVAKIAPYPTTERGKRRKEMTRNIDLIYYECTKYNNSLLANLRGKMVPEIPLKVKGLESYVDNERKYNRK